MAIQTFEQRATASITASGQTTAIGTISWTVPTLPEGATGWSSITISGTWSWDGKGNINYVNINGTNTSGGVPFNVALSTSQVSPLSITCAGNKNATGNSFSWSSLIVTYECNVVGSEVLYIKQSGTWIEVQNIYKKVNGVWVLQEDLATVFDSNTNYVKSN